MSDPLSIIECACLRLRLSTALPNSTSKLIEDAAQWHRCTDRSVTWDEIYESRSSIEAVVRIYVIMVGSNREEVENTLPEGFDEALRGMIITNHVSKLISNKYPDFDKVAEKEAESWSNLQQKNLILDLWHQLKTNWNTALKISNASKKIS